MPVTIKPVSHDANPLPKRDDSIPRPPAANAEQLLSLCSPKEHRKMTANNNIIQSSFDPVSIPYIAASDNDFIDAVLRAYDQHHHLRIRPEDIWFAIFLQLNVYINEHAEELRSFFVAHEGQKKLSIDRDFFGGKAGKDDWGYFSYLMTTKMLKSEVKDKTLWDWILPAFTTTTKHDQTIASMIMMSCMQKFFAYRADETCGIPSITLLGEKSDWEKILSRIDRLPMFGKEPQEWHGLFKLVFTRLVKSFDELNSDEMKNFWRRIVSYDGAECGRNWTSVRAPLLSLANTLIRPTIGVDKCHLFLGWTGEAISWTL